MSKKVVVIINGPAEHGKDTFVEMCSEFAQVENVDSVAKVKEAAKLLGCVSKNESDRLFLSEVTRLADTHYNHRFNLLRGKVLKMRGKKCEEDIIMFIHMREPIKIDLMKSAFKGITICISDPRKKVIKSNSSDAQVFDHVYDYNLSNEGTLDLLRLMAKSFVNQILDRV